MRFIVLSLVLLVSLPAIAQEVTPTGTIAVTDDGSTDVAIAERLRRILGELGGYEDVNVSVSSGIVTFQGTTLSSDETARLSTIAGRTEGVVAIENEVTETADVAKRLDPVRIRLQERIRQFTALTPLLAVALGAFLAVGALGWLIARSSVIARFAPNEFIADIYRMVVRLAFAVAGLVLALDILGAAALLSTILGAAGIIGLAVGFAVRDTVENFIASIMLSIRQPFRPNDAVEINGDEGLVIRLTSRATILLSFDGNHIRIPNATVFKSRILNYTTNPERRFVFEIGVAPDADLAAMRHLAEDTVAELPFTITPPGPSVWVDRIGDGAVFFKVTGWIDQRDTNLAKARGEAIRRVKAAIEASGVEVPDTTYRITLSGDIPTSPPSQTVVPTAHAQNDVEDDDITDPVPQALDRIVSAELTDEDIPNLLRQDAPKE
ncbi:MAG: mechanosensitive ion channel family protein [Pseudomonadota bacterium]